MKKRYLILLFILLLTGCNKTSMQNINTIIEEEKNMLVGINYPITNHKKLDLLIQNDVEKVYDDFKAEYSDFQSLSEQSELNIDYSYHNTDKQFIQVTLLIFIDNSHLAHPINYLKSYVYDTKKEKIVTVPELVKKESMNTLSSLSKQAIIKKYKECVLLDELKATVTPTYPYPLYTLNENSFILYFNPAEVTASYCGIIDVEIPLQKLKLKITPQQVVEEEDPITIEKPVKVIDPQKKVIALTFDDGPSTYTDEILNILKENDAYATFFVIGNKVKIYEKTLQKMVENGNEIGNHSYNHKWLTKLTEEDLREQIDQTQKVIQETTGVTPRLIRPTYGSISEKLRKQLPLEIVMWTVDTRDWKYKSINTIVGKGIKVKDLDIVLMHDTHKRTVEALKKMIPVLKQQGYEFVTVSELDEIKFLRQKNTSN